MKLLSFEGDAPRQQGQTLLFRRIMLRPQGDQVIVVDLKSPASALQVRDISVKGSGPAKEQPK